MGQCEWADYPRAVLEKHWPWLPRWRDIRTLTGDDFYAKTGLRTVVVGKDTFGKERMRKLFYRIKNRVDYYHPAFTDDVEADFRQAQMDRELYEIWGDELSPFYERYSELKRFKYDKPKKGWVDV